MVFGTVLCISYKLTPLNDSKTVIRLLPQLHIGSDCSERIILRFYSCFVYCVEKELTFPTFWVNPHSLLLNAHSYISLFLFHILVSALLFSQYVQYFFIFFSNSLLGINHHVVTLLNHLIRISNTHPNNFPAIFLHMMSFFISTTSL